MKNLLILSVVCILIDSCRKNVSSTVASKNNLVRTLVTTGHNDDFTSTYKIVDSISYDNQERFSEWLSYTYDTSWTVNGSGILVPSKPQPPNVGLGFYTYSGNSKLPATIFGRALTNYFIYSGSHVLEDSANLPGFKITYSYGDGLFAQEVYQNFVHVGTDSFFVNADGDITLATAGYYDNSTGVDVYTPSFAAKYTYSNISNPFYANNPYVAMVTSLPQTLWSKHLQNKIETISYDPHYNIVDDTIVNVQQIKGPNNLIQKSVYGSTEINWYY